MDIGEPQRVIIAEPLIGWRAWHVVDTAEGLRLHSIGRPVVWRPGVEQRATCRLHGPAVPRVDQLVDALTSYHVPLSVLDAGARGSLARALAGMPG